MIIVSHISVLLKLGSIRVVCGKIVCNMIYTLDQGTINSALVEPKSKDIENLLVNQSGRYEFLGHNHFALPLFYFENKPPDDLPRGIRWILAHKQA